MSLPEVLLWIELRKRPGGYKFRHLHPFGGFVADFYCDKGKLVIEVDGISHDMGDQPAFDQQRDAFFASHGIDTLRLPAQTVLKEMSVALDTIVAKVRERVT